MKNNKPYVSNIEEVTIENDDFRRVLYTAGHSQLVLMSVPAGESIGAEVHHVDQFFRFESGKGKSIIDGQEYEVSDGTAILVPAGLSHDIINTGAEPLKLYTIYSPANHIDGRVHATRADAMADVEDEKFGEGVAE